MSLPKCMKDNFVLVLGMSIPVLLIGLFFVMSSFQGRYALDPAELHYDIILSDAGNYDTRTMVNGTVFVENGALYVQFTRANQGFGGLPRLFIYEAAKQNMRQLDLSPPDTSNDALFGKKTVVESARSMKIDTALTSPDGFEFDYGYDNYPHGGLINELFIGGSYSTYQPRLKKGSESVPLPSSGPVRSYGTLHFIGWVVDRQGATP